MDTKMISETEDYSRFYQGVCCKDWGTGESLDHAPGWTDPVPAITIIRTPLKSIRAKCLDCGGMADVRTCTFEEECPLWPLRMGRGIKGIRSVLKPIRAYCLWCMRNQRKAVRICPSLECALHPFRFGRRASKSQRHGGTGA